MLYNKPMIKIYSIFFFLFFFSFIGLFAHKTAHIPLYIATVTGDHVNLRSEPHLDSEIFGMAFEGQKLFVTRNRGMWARVFLPNTVTFWIHSKLVRTEGENQGVVCSELAHLRVQPHVRSFSIGFVYEDQKLFILEKRYEWYKVKVPQKSFSAWISKDFIRRTLDYSLYLKNKRDEERKKVYQKIENLYLNELLFSEKQEQLKSFLPQYESFLKTYPQTPNRKLVLQRILEIGQKIQDLDWSHLEKRFMTIKKRKKIRKILLSDYRTFQKNYPHSVHLSILRQRVLMLSETNNQKEKKTKKGKYFSGYVEDLGFIWNRPGRHKLVKDGHVIFYLRSKTVHLTQYVSRFVSIRGKVIKKTSLKIPILEVDHVFTASNKGEVL